MIRISIIGLGLIGTSIGMALHNADASTAALGATRVVGYDQDSHAISTARGRLAIDEGTRSLAEAVCNAHLVVLATPVQAMRDTLAELATLLPNNAIVTDTASTKAQVCRWANEHLPAHISFVGGHPMAGKEQAGAQAAVPDLFQDAIYCLIPGANTPQVAINVVEALVADVGARPYYIDADEHDAYVAGISHLPFILSTALVQSVSRGPAWKEMAALAASGFRDVSRLASGDVVMHRDICLTNRVALLRWIDDMIITLQTIRDQLDASDAAELEQLFAEAKTVRDTWLSNQSGLRPGEEALTRTSQTERPGIFGKLWSSDHKRRS